MIYFLTIAIAVCAYIAYRLNKKELAAPSFIFSLSFLFCTCWACIYADEWGLTTMNIHTVLVILLGVILYIAVAFAVSKFFSRSDKKHKKDLVKKEEKKSGKLSSLQISRIPTIVKIASILFMGATLWVCLNAVIKAVSGSWSNIGDAINTYDQLSKFSDDTSVGIGSLAGNLKIVANALMYWFLYVAVQWFIDKKKIDVLSVLIVLIGAAITMSTGGRNAAINLALAIPALYIILLSNRKDKQLKLTLKSAIVTVLAVVAGLALFPQMNALLGRNSKHDDEMYYLAIYCGAEVKNLDMFIDEYDKEAYPLEENNQTFNVMNNWLGTRINNSESYKLDLPFRKTGSRTLGNVYTTYYPYIYDYGYLGVVWCVAIMSALTQIVYEKSKRDKNNATLPNVFVLMYSFMFSSIVFSFFSNKFYEQNFSKRFIVSIVIWVIMNYVIKLTFGWQRKNKKDNEEIS